MRDCAAHEHGLPGREKSGIALGDRQRVEIFDQPEKQQRPGNRAGRPAPGNLGERQRRPAKGSAEAFERGRDSRHRSYFTTRLSSLPGTNIFLTICLPATADCTFSSASAWATTKSSDESAGTTTRPRNLPLICTGISSSSSLASAASYFGQGALSRLPFSPSISQSSWARYGAKG